MDITYVPMARGFVYLVAVLDWFSRKVLAWRLSITLETGPCVEALTRRASSVWYCLQIMNTDQGSQFTSVAFLKVLQDAKIAISMDGKGAWRDNIFVERLWRTIKYEEVYLRAYRSVSEARRGLARYLAFYNRRRPHSSLGGQTPDQVIFQPAHANLGGGITRAEIHLSTVRNLFKITEPPLSLTTGFYLEAVTEINQSTGRPIGDFPEHFENEYRSPTEWLGKFQVFASLISLVLLSIWFVANVYNIRRNP